MKKRILLTLLAGTVILQPCQMVMAEELGGNDFNESDMKKPTGFDLAGCKYESENQGFYIFRSESVDLYGMVDANGNVVLPAVADEMEFLNL